MVRALDLENESKYREAAALFRHSLSVSPTPGALLGLERVYAELGISDSLLPPLDSLIARHPREGLYRSVKLRTLQMLGRQAALREAFEQWAAAAPRDPSPYREYARILIRLGQPTAADSIVQRGAAAVGSARALDYESAQLRAAEGKWEASAQAWRSALVDAHPARSASGRESVPPDVAHADLDRTDVFWVIRCYNSVAFHEQNRRVQVFRAIRLGKRPHLVAPRLIHNFGADGLFQRPPLFYFVVFSQDGCDFDGPVDCRPAQHFRERKMPLLGPEFPNAFVRFLPMLLYNPDYALGNIPHFLTVFDVVAEMHKLVVDNVHQNSINVMLALDVRGIPNADRF